MSSATAPITPADSEAQLDARVDELGQVLLGRMLEDLDGNFHHGCSRTATSPEGLPFAPKERGPRTRFGSALRQLRRATDPKGIVKSIVAIAILAIAAPARNLLRTLLRRHPIRVFTFHRVSSICRDGMTVAPDIFDEQLRYIARTHHILPLGKCLDLGTSRVRLAKPVAAITFDDGYRSVYTNALPIMRREGLVGACFVSTDLVASTRRFAHDASLPTVDLLEVMDWAELDALHAEGWEIGGHTATHARLSQCDGAMLDEELARPLAALWKRLGITRPAFAYPFGGRADITRRGVELARRAGYSACLSDFGGENHPPFDTFDVRRIELGGDHPTLAWKTRVHGMDVGGLRRRDARRHRLSRLWQAPPVNA